LWKEGKKGGIKARCGKPARGRDAQASANPVGGGGETQLRPGREKAKTSADRVGGGVGESGFEAGWMGPHK